MHLKFSSIWSVFVFILVASTVAKAQWNWPEDKKTAQEKVVLYTDAKKQGNLEAAVQPLGWLLENAPDLNPSIYINGADIYEDLAQKETDAAKKKEYTEKALQMYDTRIKYFGGEADLLNKKASAAAKLLYSNKEQHDTLSSIFSKALKANKEKFAYYNIFPYMAIAKGLYEQKKMSQDELIDVYDKLNEVVDKNAGGKDAAKYQEQAEKVDAIFIQTIDVDCNFIADKLVPKMKENPGDTDIAKKIIALSLASECTDQPYFTEAAIATFNKEPNAGLAKTIGERMMREGSEKEAMEFLNKAAQLSESNQQKAEVYLSMASINLKQGNRNAARDYAIKAAQTDQSVAGKAYTTVGNMYMNSYEECKGGKSEIEDRAVFLAAYEMYQKAGDSQGMAHAKEQFPSKELVFTHNKKVGGSIKVGCWINETVTIRTRD